jgi:hypothetical protein
VLIFFIAGLLYLLRFERVDNLGAYRIPPETGLLIPSVNRSYRAATFRVIQKMSRPDIGRPVFLVPNGSKFSNPDYGASSKTTPQP